MNHKHSGLGANQKRAMQIASDLAAGNHQSLIAAAQEMGMSPQQLAALLQAAGQGQPISRAPTMADVLRGERL
jgi:hypothetical protein